MTHKKTRPSFLKCFVLGTAVFFIAAAVFVLVGAVCAYACDDPGSAVKIFGVAALYCATAAGGAASCAKSETVWPSAAVGALILGTILIASAFRPEDVRGYGVGIYTVMLLLLPALSFAAGLCSHAIAARRESGKARRKSRHRR